MKTRSILLILTVFVLVSFAGFSDFGTFAQSTPGLIIQPSSYAAPLPLDRGATGLWQTLKRLHTRASLLQITAHPDDEDGGMLAYESRGQGARTMLLCLTRGEGGANVMSDDYFDALGLVRTEELLMAARFYGAQVYWGRFTDYGFSKFKEETLQKWDHDRVLGDAVRVVRMTHPLVVTSVFIGGPTDGHGNHQTTGQIMQEVFVAAGDPKAFPDQLQEGLRPWSPLKAYGRTPTFMRAGGGSAYNYIEKKPIPAPIPVNVTVSSGTYDPVLGLNYVQIAREGLGFQKCQNGGTGTAPSGESASSYTRFGSRVSAAASEESLFDGIDVSLGGIASLAGGGEARFLKQGLAEINTLVELAIRELSLGSPEKIAPTLAAGMKATATLIEQVETSSLGDGSKYDIIFELQNKRAQFNDALVQALGLSVEAALTSEKPPTGRFAAFMGPQESFQVAIPGQKFWVNVHITNQGSVPVRTERVYLAGPENESWSFGSDGPISGTLVYNKPRDIRFTVDVPENAGFTRPYFTRPSIEQAYYDIIDKRYLNLSHAPYPLSAWVDLYYEGVPLRVGEVVQTIKRMTGPGVVRHPLAVAPAISVTLTPGAGVVPLDAKSISLTATLRSNVKGPAHGALRLELPQGWTSTPPGAEFSTANDGDEQTVAFQLHPASVRQTMYKVTAVAEYNGRQYREGYRTTGYSGLRPYYLYHASTFTASGVDVKVAPGLTVGYIMGSGDEVPQSLGNLGIKVDYLTTGDLSSGDLGKYKVILLGVRTYAVRLDLKTYNARLLDYVRNGGVVIVQYNTPEYDHNYGPYAYTQNNPEEVTYEDSPMQILIPDHPVFAWPNRITLKDFDGWVEERGSKFLRTWDPHYEALLETHDPNQEPQKGGLVYARYGKGVYVYCAYAFYRQLPEGVPGAYRLFANLVSLPANPRVFGGKN